MALRIATNIARNSTIASIYQAGEPIYKVFDKVCLISEGKMVYFGPSDLAREYFINMGYEPVNRQSTADFLVAVTDPHGRTVRAGFENKVPRTVDDFVAYYRNSYIYQLNKEDMESYRHEFVEPKERTSAFMASAEAEHATTTNKKSAYVISIPMQIVAVMVRRFQILSGAIATSVIDAG
jgi:ATP-binding cassette subfamily G (WHITE) protein 2 (SNQ2)